MRYTPLLLLVAAVVASCLAPLGIHVVSAQVEPTAILGEPIVITPLTTAEPEAPNRDGPRAPASTATAPTSPALAPAEPDRCEPNNAPEHACTLPLDAVSGPFTIVPEDDQDFFRLDLPEEASIQTVITARSTAGLDLFLSARQGYTLVTSGTASLTFAPGVAGPVVLRVENRDPRPAAGEQYRLEVRREIAPPSQGEQERDAAPKPDALENNWSFETAAAIAVGVVYDLTFACPDPRLNACPGGDHDHLLVPVKAGVSYLVTTFDLDPGVDTVIELFWGSTTTPIVGNDDYGPGGALSALRWTAPGDGILGVRVAPRNGGLPQHLAEAKAGYRFAVAPEAGELARKLDVTIRQQANIPNPTATTVPATTSGGSGTPGGSSSTAGGSLPPAAGGAALQESITPGSAIIVRETVLRREPSERAAALTTLAPTLVSVRGPVSGLWVSIETEASILPGWVRASDLQRITPSAATPKASQGGQGGPSATPDSQQSGAATLPSTVPTSGLASTPTSAAVSGPRVDVTALDPALPPPPPSPVARVPFALVVTVVATDRPSTGGSALGFATPTPDMRLPVKGVRVQLVNVFGDVLAEGLTDAQGRAPLRRDVRPGDKLAVRIPAWGVDLPLDAEQSTLTVTIPEAKR